MKLTFTKKQIPHLVVFVVSAVFFYFMVLA